MHLVIAAAGAIIISAMPVESCAQLLAGACGPGEGIVYAYQGGTNWTAISPPLGDAVLDIVNFNGTLYAATMSYDLGGGVWQYNGGASWTAVGTNMDEEVCALAIYNGQLYAGTAGNGGRLYCYNGANFVYVGAVSNFYGIRAMYASSYGCLQLGDIESDIFGHYDGTNLYFDTNFGNSCVVDFAEYNNELYAGTEECAYLFGSTNGINWSIVLGCPGDAYALWQLQPFQGQLYLGYDNGQLGYMDSSNTWNSVLTVSDSIISMAAAGDAMLYFGAGVGAVGDVENGAGPGFVYAYAGNGATNATLISGPMGAGVQCLYYPADALQIIPAAGFDATGCVGGPFSITNESFSLTNIGTAPLNWSLANSSTWLDASPGGGTLAVGGTTNVTVSLNSNAYSLSSGAYTATVWITNLNDGVWQSCQFTLAMISLTGPANQTVMAGGTATFSVAVSGPGPFSYQWQFNGANLGDGRVITTVAGGGTNYPGDGGPATNAGLSYLQGVAVDASGNLFIADTGRSLIRKVDTNGLITTVAGGGTNSAVNYNGPATNATLSGPSSVAVDASGNLFIADTGHNLIRKADSNGIIATVAGGGTNSAVNYNGPAANASLDSPFGVAVDASGNLFISDTWHYVIRKVDTNGLISTVAGNGAQGYSGDHGPATNASLFRPSGVALDTLGNLFIADTVNNVIRKVDTNGIITTVAGNYNTGGSYGGDGGQATNASLDLPYDAAPDTLGNLFIADTVNNVIRKVDTNGIITTVAGNYNTGGSYGGDGGQATNASLYFPFGAAVDASGNLFIADTDNQRIRKVALFASYPTLTLGNVTPNNAGNYSVNITGPYGTIASSIVTLTVASSPIISQIICNPDASVTLYLLTAPNTSSRVLVTTNLELPVVWQPLCTNVAAPSGAWQFTDTNASQYPIRVYRSSTP